LERGREPCDPRSVPIPLRSSLVLTAIVLSLWPLWPVSALWSPVASAREKNEATKACEGKKDGEACTVMTLTKPASGGPLERRSESGLCKPDECCELDYSKGSPPETICGPCLACEVGGYRAAPQPKPVGPSAEDPSREAPRNEGESDPPAPAGNAQRGCAVTVGMVPPWAALIVLAPWAAGRRRVRRAR
jgi:hypothetical protein